VPWGRAEEFSCVDDLQRVAVRDRAGARGLVAQPVVDEVDARAGEQLQDPAVVDAPRDGPSSHLARLGGGHSALRRTMNVPIARETTPSSASRTVDST